MPAPGGRILFFWGRRQLILPLATAVDGPQCGVGIAEAPRIVEFYPSNQKRRWGSYPSALRNTDTGHGNLPWPFKEKKLWIKLHLLLFSGLPSRLSLDHLFVGRSFEPSARHRPASPIRFQQLKWAQSNRTAVPMAMAPTIYCQRRPRY